MLMPRAIPCLLKRNSALVKTTKFKSVNYIGDAINTIQIFNNLEVDEIVILDITATQEHRSPDLSFISNITNEAFIPLAYGGGIRDIETMKKVINLGTEKIVVCTYAYENPDFITQAADQFGSQSIIVSVDVKKNFWGKYEVFINNGTKNTGEDPIEYAKSMEQRGAGEIFLNSIDHDGTMLGYDTILIKKVTSSISIPLIACGGAGEINDLKLAVDAGASAAAAGSLFVYQGKNRSVLVNFPPQTELQELFRGNNT